MMIYLLVMSKGLSQFKTTTIILTSLMNVVNIVNLNQFGELLENDTTFNN